MRSADQQIRIFISYTPSDERWAKWTAWTLERAGHPTTMQAWDFEAGTKLADFIEEGIAAADLVVAIISAAYQASADGRLEWRTAVQAEPGAPAKKLLVLRVGDCRIDDPLATDQVDLVGVDEAENARGLLLARVRRLDLTPSGPPVPSGRRRPRTAPPYPPDWEPAREPSRVISVLHLSSPRFGRTDQPQGAGELQQRINRGLGMLTEARAPQPDLLVVTGDLMDTGSRQQAEQALEFLVGLRVLLELETTRVIVVPGPHDVSLSACRAYFDLCEADGIEPTPPYSPKWRHFMRLFEELYRGSDGPEFDGDRPWSLFPVPELRLVVAGLNSTLTVSHLDQGQDDGIGTGQAEWFGRELAPYEDAEWLRLGAAARMPAAFEPTSPLGKRLNLVLCGSAQAPPASAPPVVPLPAPGSFQLLEVTPGQVLRHTPAEGHVEAELVHKATWASSTKTFQRDAKAVAGSSTARQPPDREGTPPAELADRTTESLIERVTEICKIKYDHVQIRRVAGDIPHLRLTYSHEGFPYRLRIWPFVGSPGEDDIARFSRAVQALEPDLPTEIVYDGSAPSYALRDSARRRGIRVLSFIEFQGLLDLRDHVATQTMALTRSRQYPPSLYVPQRFRYAVGPDELMHDDIVEELLRLVSSDETKFVLVLGDFGRGKTFALREVARRIPSASSVALQRLVPLLIELRSLEKDQSVTGLVASHLAKHGQKDFNTKAFDYMLREGRIVLLFDGFDELVARVDYVRAAKQLEMLVKAVGGQAKIVVSSRRQHFRTDGQVLTALGEKVGQLRHRHVMQLEDFTDKQIRQYLVNRHHGDHDVADHRLDLLRSVEDLLELSHNPRMLSFIAELDPENLRAVAQADQAISPAVLYEEILQAWLGHEVRRARGVAGAPPGPGEGDLWTAVTALALRMWESNETQLKLDELVDVAGALTSLSEVRLTKDEAAHALGSGSLLVRGDDGRFGFIHRSVMEWLVARHLATLLDDEDERSQVLMGRRLSQLIIDFLVDLAHPSSVERWVRGVLDDPALGGTARENAVRLGNRLRIPAGADLRGVKLSGEDLSFRDLRQVDLTGADLSDTRLTSTDLSGAILRGARLVGARLDQTRLRGADLRDADLSRARLLHADVREAQLGGGVWRRAALIDVVADESLLAAPEIRDAAVAPRHGVVPSVGPSAVGVSFGFETGRIAEPVAYSPDGDILAVGSDDGSVLLCDATTGMPVRTLHGHTGRAYAVAYGPPGTVLVTGSDDDTVRLWQPNTGEPLGVLTGHEDWVWPMVLNKEGTSLLAGDSSGTATLWDLTTRTVSARLPGHSSRLWTAAFSPDGTMLATGDDSGSVRVFDTSTGQLRHTLPAADSATFRVAYSPDGRLLATAGKDGVARLWDATSEKLERELSGHPGAIYTLSFHPDGEVLAAGDTTGEVRLWNLNTGQFTPVPVPRRSPVYDVRFSHDGKLLATAHRDGLVQLCDGVTGELELDLPGHRGAVWPVAFRRHGDQLMTSSNDGTTRLWHIPTGECRQTLRGHGRKVHMAHFSPDGHTLASSGNDGKVRLWNPLTGRRRAELAAPAEPLVSAIFSPVQPLLATVSGDGVMLLWNTDTGANERRLNIGTTNVWAAAFSGDGETLATANDDDSVHLWGHLTGRRILVLPNGEQTPSGHRGRVRAISFDPLGATVATGCDDSKVRIWDRASGDCKFVLSRHDGRVYAVAYSPDGTRLVSVGHDGLSHVWDAATGTVRHTLGVSGFGRLWTAAFSPDGATIATGGDDLIVRLWDPLTGGLRHELTGHTRRISSVAYSPGGDLLASSSDDGTVLIWALSGPDGPRLRLMLVSFGEAWAALSPDGRYKVGGDIGAQAWHAIGTCRFELGELTPYLPMVRPMALDAEF